jgi:predicted ester cyclase
MGHIQNPPLTSDNNLEKTDESLAAAVNMTEALQAGSNNMAAHFHSDFRWIANTGCGVKHGIEEFRRNWQLPLRAAFSDRSYNEEARLAQGEWVSSFGYIDAIHSGEFMGIAPTGKRVKIKYIDFWKIKDGKIADNYVNVDFASVLAQLGVDVFNGEGWEKYDEGLVEPPRPADFSTSIGEDKS